jgi:hypothetical protein
MWFIQFVVLFTVYCTFSKLVSQKLKCQAHNYKISFVSKAKTFVPQAALEISYCKQLLFFNLVLKVQYLKTWLKKLLAKIFPAGEWWRLISGKGKEIHGQSKGKEHRYR